jgi:hypothetical protein
MEKYLCRCSECSNFTRDRIGSGDGIGTCAPYEAIKKQAPHLAGEAFQRLGGRVFWGNDDGVDDRYCERFIRRSAGDINTDHAQTASMGYPDRQPASGSKTASRQRSQ